MIGYRNEHTIATSCEVTGRGYWTGQDVCVQFHPAPVGSGVVLSRSDLDGQPTCPAKTTFADGIQFRTNLSHGDAKFEMVEHLLAALAGLEIDNCFVEVDALELPGLDGSSDAFVRSLQSAGLVIQAATKPQLVIEHAFKVTHLDASIEVSPSTDGLSHFGYQLDYGAKSCIKKQSYEVRSTPREFARQVAPARTFVTLEQAEQLRSNGVALHVTNRDLLVIGQHGVVDNQLRFRNECARHKTLDLVGDLSLVGVDLIGNFRSHRGGHRLNGILANQLADMAASAERSTVLHQRESHLGVIRRAA